MARPAGGVPANEPDFLGSAPATPRDRRNALIVGAILVVAFVATVPWASRPLHAVPAFAPIYNAAIIVLDVLTALLLYAQYRNIREPSLLALTCGYVFTPLLIAAHGLSFPDAYVPGSLIGGSQTTAWLGMAWHTLFPLFVAGYALLARGDRRRVAPPQPVRRSRIMLALSATVALALLVILIATAGESWLPPLMFGDTYRSPTTRFILGIGWLAHVAALVVLLWSTRGRRLIDVWMSVTLVALTIDLALSAIFVSGRYQLGFYLGRVYGLVGASFVLVVLMREASTLYSRFFTARTVEARETVRLLLLAAEEEERRRLARELHDEVGQHLTAVSLGLQSLADVAVTGSEIDRRATRLRELVDTLSRELHSLALRLRPRALDDFGLEAALEAYAVEWARNSGIRVDIHTRAGGERLPASVESAVYRIVQEALTNIAKHSGASSASIVVERRDGQAITIVEDNGRGFDPDGIGHPGSLDGRLGLLGMRERASLLGGTLEVESSPGASTTVFARIPIRNEGAVVAKAPRNRASSPASRMTSRNSAT